MDIDLLYENIKATLFPTFESKLTDSPERNHLLMKSFEQHTQILARYCYDYFAGSSSISKEFIQGLHRLLYPSGYIIKNLQYDGVVIENTPWEWRRQNFLHNNQCIDSSHTSTIEVDMEELLDRYNSLAKKDRTDMLELYCILIRIHPFGDSNGTVSAMVADIECLRQGVSPIHLLHIRFKEKLLLFRIVRTYDEQRDKLTLQKLLIEIDNFHNRTKT